MPLSDEDFKERLETGKKFEQYVADKLNENGFDAVVPDEAGKKYKDAEEFARLDTDIVVSDKILEVKSRADTCIFTGPDDFPFKDIYLDTKSGWEKKEQKPDYYVVVSQQTGGIIVVPGDTRDEWSCRKVYDRRCGFASETLVADRGLGRSLDWMMEELRDN